LGASQRHAGSASGSAQPIAAHRQSSPIGPPAGVVHSEGAVSGVPALPCEFASVVPRSMADLSRNSRDNPFSRPHLAPHQPRIVQDWRHHASFQPFLALPNASEPRAAHEQRLCLSVLSYGTDLHANILSARTAAAAETYVRGEDVAQALDVYAEQLAAILEIVSARSGYLAASQRYPHLRNSLLLTIQEFEWSQEISNPRIEARVKHLLEEEAKYASQRAQRQKEEAKDSAKRGNSPRKPRPTKDDKPGKGDSKGAAASSSS